MTNKLRKVEFECFLNNSNHYQNTDKLIGYFHQWGLALIDEKNITIAIIETEDGQVYRAFPESVTFVDIIK